MDCIARLSDMWNQLYIIPHQTSVVHNYSLAMSTKATFCQLYQQPNASTANFAVPIRYAYISVSSSLRLRQTKHFTGDLCDGGISVLNHCLS